MLVFGHRGAAGIAPENTIRSIQEALRSKVDAIEIDVAICRTGEIILMHDNTVDRTTNSTGEVSEMDFCRLRQLIVEKTEKIPTLLEALQEIQGSIPLNIEIKGRNSSSAVCSLLKKETAAGRVRIEDVIISSFNHRELIKVQEIMPEVRISPIISCTPQEISCIIGNLRPWSINIDISAVSEEIVEEIHSLGIQVLVFTVNTPQQYRCMESIGVDGIFTDNKYALKLP